MRHAWILLCAIAALSALAWLPAASGDEATSAATSATTPTTAAAPTTTAPTKAPAKVKVLESELCKTCACDEKNKQLDCNEKLKRWFNDAEWETLQNGDITFDIIKLQHNNLTAVPQLRDYPVKSLYLGFNQIASIAAAAFQNLSEITTLGLSHNALTPKALHPDIFKGRYSPDAYLPLAHLTELDLGYNDLHTLDADLFENLPALATLILCGNTFQVIDQPAETAIAGLASLKTLDLSYMELHTLPENFLHGPRDLETLIMNGNLFHTLPPNLDYAKNLRQLTLDENPFEDFAGSNVFPLMPYLEYLSISYLTNVTKIANGALSNLPKLTTLVATSNTKLTVIEPKAFAKVTINPDIYDYPPLQKLYLHNGNLSVLERDWLVRWDKVRELDVTYNPWLCDCTNSYLIHTLMAQVNATTPQHSDDVVCASPAGYKGVRVIDIRAGTGAKQLNCAGEVYVPHDTLILVGLFVGILIGIPLTIGTLIVYRRGCFGLTAPRSSGARPLYNRASFSDEFHI